jgi:hypothetical protein
MRDVRICQACRVTDWAAWHTRYENPNSPLSQRLDAVRSEVAAALDRAPEGPVRVLSLCAGRGLDLLPLLPVHVRGADVQGRLVELDPENAEVARASAPVGIEVVQADAGVPDACVGAVPADLLLLCGIFGNVSDEDVERTVAAVPQLCAPRATVVWTRSTRAPDLTPAVRRWVVRAGVEETSFVTEGPGGWSVGAGTFLGRRESLVPGSRMFSFTTSEPRAGG